MGRGVTEGVARGGSGVPDVVGALASQVHPVFMLPAVAASGFGAVLAGEFAPGLALLHAVAIFAALYTAHVKDGYVDFYGRGEDDDHPLTARGCRLALAGATALFAACLTALWWLVGPGAAALTLPAWLVAYFHAPQLDTNPVTATVGYPLGIAVAIVSGYYVQAGALAAAPLAAATVFLVVLSGVKVVDDATDYEYDRSIGKRTVAVVLGRRRAHQVAYGLMSLGLLVALGSVAGAVFPPTAVLAVVAFGAVAVVARRAEPELATMLLIRGAYLFLAGLVAAVWFRPLG